MNKSAFEGMIVEDIIKYSRQVKDLPIGFKMLYKKPIEDYAEKLVEDLSK